MLDDTTVGEVPTIPLSPAERLRARWEVDPPVDLDAFLNEWQDLPPKELAEVITVDQDERWRRGDRVPAESYLSRFPFLDDDLELALWIVYGEVLATIHDGNEPELTVYQARFPHLHEMLALQWEVHEAFRQSLPGDQSPSSFGHSSLSSALQFSAAVPPKPEPEGYELYEELGRGALGVVYRAKHRRLDRIVALKILREAPLMESEAFLRFFEEARLMAKLEHPRIVRVFDVGRHEGWPYIALEWVEGESLADRLNGQVLSPNEAAALLLAVIEGVRFAHENDVTHRDLKPANILIDQQGLPRITDFGLAKQGANGLALTKTGELVGTPAYMSPEQALAGPKIGPLSDIYSLGAILYEMLTGRPPLLASSFGETILLVSRQQPVSPDAVNALVPTDLAAVCMKCLEKLPKRRYSSAEALQSDLQRFLNGERTLARPLGSLAKSYRWSLANPLPSALLVAVVSALMLGLGGISYFAYQASVGEAKARLAERNAIDLLEVASRARNEKAAALTQTEQALDRAEWLVYSGTLEKTYSQLADRDFQRDHGMLSTIRWDFRGPEFGLVSNLSRRQSKQLFGHSRQVRAVVYSPDGQTLATGSDDGTVKLWETESKRLIDTYEFGLGKINAVAFQREANALCLGDDKGVILVVDLATKRQMARWSASANPIRRLAKVEGSNQLVSLDSEGVVTLWSDDHKVRDDNPSQVKIRSIQADPSGKRIAAVGEDAVYVWDAASGNEIRRIVEPALAAKEVAISPDGKVVAATVDESMIKAWDIETGSAIRIFSGHTDPISALQFSPDGRWLAAGLADGRVWLWSVKTAVGHLALNSHLGVVNDLAFRPQGDELAVASEDPALTLFDPSKDAGIVHVPGVTFDQLQIPFSLDGRTIAAPGAQGGVDLWNIETGSLIRSFGTKSGKTRAVAFDPEGKILVTGGEDNSIAVWNVADAGLLRTIEIPEGTPSTLAHHPSRPEAAISIHGGLVVTHDLQSGRRLMSFPGHKESVLTVAYSPDGERIVTASFDKTVRVWDRADGRCLVVINLPDPAIRVAISPDGERLLTSTWSSDFAIWDFKTGANLGHLQGHGRTVTGVAFSADGRRLISASNDGSIRFWHSRLLIELLAVQTGSGLTQLSVCKNGRNIAAMSADGKLRIWETGLDEPIESIYPNSGAVTTAQFRPDGKQFLTIGRNGTCQLWNAASGRIQTILNNQEGSILAAAYSTLGDRLATAGSTGQVQFWQPATGEPSGSLGARGRPIARLSFQPQGRLLAVIRDNGSVDFWDLETKSISEDPPFADELPCTDIVWSLDGKLITRVTTNGTLVHTAIDDGHSSTVALPGRTFRKAVWGPNRERLYGLTAEGEVVVFNGLDGSIVRQWQAHSQADGALALSKDGKKLVTGGVNETVVKLWQAESGTLEYEFPCQSHSVLDVSISRDGRRILTGSEDTTSKMIELSPEDKVEVYRR